MDNELLQIINGIKNKINKDITVYSELGDNFISTSDTETAERCEERFENVFQNSESGKTYFRFRYKTENLIGILDGAEEAEKNYAFLITAVIESANIADNITAKGDYLKSIVLGECNNAQIQKYMHKCGVPDIACTVLIISSSGGKTGDIINLLENFKSNQCDSAVITDDMTIAYIKYQDSEQSENEYNSVTDYAQLLSQSISEEINLTVKIGVGSTVKNLCESAISYQQALSAIRMGVVFSSKSDVQTYKEYVLVKMLEDLPKYKLQEFLEILLEPDAKTIFSDSEMTGTAEEFLENSLNVSETSRNLFMHRNTLMYRLDKIDRATGLDIRKFQDAVTFRLITILYKLLA